VKIAFLSSIYLKNCESIYKKRKELITKTYDEQQLAIEEETICSIGQWRHYLLDKGFESIMLCRNNLFIQQKWCEENDFVPSSDDTEFEIVKEQVIRLKPDILFVFGASYYHKNNRLEKLVKENPTIKKNICWYGAPEGDDGIFMEYDLVLTNSLTLRDSIRGRGVKSEQLNHAFEPIMSEIIKHDGLLLGMIDGRLRSQSLIISANKIMSGGHLLLDNSDRLEYNEGMNYLEKLGWKRIKLVGLCFGYEWDSHTSVSQKK
jgi:hypothetical protein